MKEIARGIATFLDGDDNIQFDRTTEQVIPRDYLYPQIDEFLTLTEDIRTRLNEV